METFVVRVWTPATGEAMPGLRGTATRLRSGDEISFSDPETLLGFMAKAVDATRDEAET
jgi:hypothetical protein